MDTLPTDRVHFEMSPEGTWARAGERWTYTGPCDMIMEMETSERGTIRCQRYGTRIVSVTFPPGGLSPPSHFEYDPVEDSDSSPPVSPAAAPAPSVLRPSAVRDMPECFPVRERSAAAAALEDEEDPEEYDTEEDAEAEEAPEAEAVEAEVPDPMVVAEDGLWFGDEDVMSEDEAPYPWLQDADPGMLHGVPVGWDMGPEEEEPLPQYHVRSPDTDLSGECVVVQASSPESSEGSTASSRVW